MPANLSPERRSTQRAPVPLTRDTEVFNALDVRQFIEDSGLPITPRLARVALRAACYGLRHSSSGTALVVTRDGVAAHMMATAAAAHYLAANIEEV